MNDKMGQWRAGVSPRKAALHCGHTGGGGVCAKTRASAVERGWGVLNDGRKLALPSMCPCYTRAQSCGTAVVVPAMQAGACSVTRFVTPYHAMPCCHAMLCTYFGKVFVSKLADEIPGVCRKQAEKDAHRASNIPPELAQSIRQAKGSTPLHMHTHTYRPPMHWASVIWSHDAVVDVVQGPR